jgi:hypothetical protein
MRAVDFSSGLHARPAARAVWARRRVTQTTALCLLATSGIVLQQALHAPLQLPGHRGLIWLTLLVAVRLGTSRTGLATAVGAASGLAIFALGLNPNGAIGALPYLVTAAAIDAVAATALLRARPWLLALAAAPIHLLALADPISRSLRVGVTPTGLLETMQTVFYWHLAFGLAAGLLGWGLALAWREQAKS